MIGAAKQYSELLTKLLVDRELAGGSLPEEIERQAGEAQLRVDERG